jgi:TonB family protein
MRAGRFRYTPGESNRASKIAFGSPLVTLHRLGRRNWGNHLNRYLVALASSSLICIAASEPRQVRYGDAPSWVLPPPASAELKPTEAPLRVVFQDTEDRIVDGTDESYTAYRVKILKPEGLALGNITMNWLPSAGPATVHYVRIIRDGKTVDVLKQQRFKVLEREADLEQSVLSGALTATLQVPGLQVGDELEFAATIVRSTPAFGKHAAGTAQLPWIGLPGAYRYRLLWRAEQPLAWRATKDMAPAGLTTEGQFKSLLVELRDPPSVVDVEGAPPRFNWRRTVEYSDFPSWVELSRVTWPLFDKAAQLAPDSPLLAEAARIAASTSDPTERVQAALRLVQDQIRYVYVGLDGGNYRPASADETWKRRFGDCKAKTAVLLALLRRLGIEAEPALVNSKGGDGTNERLPSPALFDHILVRANVAGQLHWLDGTRLGDRFLDMLPQPAFQWALPLTASGSDLIPVPPALTPYPDFISIVDIDATAGLTKDAVYQVETVYHGDAAFVLRTTLASLNPADADRAVTSYWHQQLDRVNPTKVGWKYDERHGSLTLSLKGQGKPNWDGSDSDGHSLSLPGGGFNPPDRLERPKDQNQSAAWSVEYPRFRCFATTIHLPPPTGRFRWTYRSKPMNRRLAGALYWRAAGMRGNVVRIVMSRQSYVREISADEATQLNNQIAGFDNNMSAVDETLSPDKPQSATLPFADGVDWVGNAAPCSPPSLVAPQAQALSAAVPRPLSSDLPRPTAIDRGSWFSENDYPVEALKNGDEGSVEFEVEVDALGRSGNCRIIASSGHPLLDGVTCNVLRARAQFRPAVGPDGKAVSSVYRSKAVWTGAAGGLQAYHAAILDLSDPRHPKCAEQNDGNGALEPSCSQLLQQKEYVQVLGRKFNRVVFLLATADDGRAPYKGDPSWGKRLTYLASDQFYLGGSVAAACRPIAVEPVNGGNACAELPDPGQLTTDEMKRAMKIRMEVSTFGIARAPAK